MIEIGAKPILWHIMKIYSAHGVDEFVVCLGYKGYVIKEYFANYHLHACDVTFDLAGGRMEIHQSSAEPWKVTLVETGDRTMTGGRLRRVLPYLEGEEAFCFTYGDGVADLDVPALLDFHRRSGTLATVTGVQPPGRFGALEIEDGRVSGFREKPQGDGGWINGGFFVLSPEVGRYLHDDATVWEEEPLEGLARDGELALYQHRGFWQAMDTLRDQRQLQELWNSGDVPWKLWQ